LFIISSVVDIIIINKLYSNKNNNEWANLGDYIYYIYYNFLISFNFHTFSCYE